jgi:hypothetical protein
MANEPLWQLPRPIHGDNTNVAIGALPPTLTPIF